MQKYKWHPPPQIKLSILGKDWLILAKYSQSFYNFLKVLTEFYEFYFLTCNLEQIDISCNFLTKFTNQPWRLKFVSVFFLHINPSKYFTNAVKASNDFCKHFKNSVKINNNNLFSGVPFKTSIYSNNRGVSCHSLPLRLLPSVWTECLNHIPMGLLLHGAVKESPTLEVCRYSDTFSGHRWCFSTIGFRARKCLPDRWLQWYWHF